MATKTAGKRQTAKQSDAALQKKVVADLKAGKSLSEVASDYSITTGKAAFLRMCAEVKPADRIKGTDSQVAKAIVKARNSEGQSWGRIAARASLPEGKVKSIYTEATGKDTKGLRLEGKGGRAVKSTTKRQAKRGKAATTKTAGRKRGKRGKRSGARANPSTAA